jgi:hypothetical protein
MRYGIHSSQLLLVMRDAAAKNAFLLRIAKRRKIPDSYRPVLEEEIGTYLANKDGSTTRI